MKRIYETSRGFLELEAFETLESREVWISFFDEDGWARHRVSWGPDAIEQPDFNLRGQIRAHLHFEGFPAEEAERLAEQMAADVRVGS